MSLPEPVPPPGASRTRDRALHTSLQLPREAKWSRTSSIALSVLLHIALILAIRQWVWIPIVSDDDKPVFHVFQLDQTEPLPPPIVLPHVDPPVAPAVTEPPASQTIVTQAPPALPVIDEELVQPNEIPTGIPAGGAPIAEPTGMAAPRTPAERLLRTGLDPALIPVRPGMIPPAVSPQQAARDRLYAGIEAYNDSMAAAAADADNSKDWVKKGRDGKQWGIAPDGIYIGSVKLPLPNFGFSGPSGRREETAGKLRSYAEGNAQARRMELEETFESRVKAMRARKDAQRDSARAAKRGGG